MIFGEQQPKQTQNEIYIQEGSTLLLEFFTHMSLAHFSDVYKLKYDLKKQECLEKKYMTKKQIDDLELIYIHLHYGNLIHLVDPDLRTFLINKVWASNGFLNTNQTYIIHSFTNEITNQIFELCIHFQYESVEEKKREMKYRIHRGWKLVSKEIQKKDQEEMQYRGSTHNNNNNNNTSKPDYSSMPSLHEIPNPDMESNAMDLHAMEPNKTKLCNTIIASCSTVPGRVSHKLFQATVEGLVKNDRISKIIINYPKYCQRLKQSYPEVPKWMLNHDKIQVNTKSPDFGPFTKIIPLLDGYTPKSDIGVLLFDDDLYYPKNWINNLIDGFESHNRLAAVGKQGSLHKSLPYQFNKFNQTWSEEQYLVMKTQKGVIYPFKMFPSSSKEAMEFVNKYNKDELANNNSDIILASWAHKSDVPMYVLPTSNIQMQEWNLANETAIEDEFDLKNGSMKDEVKLMHELQKDSNFPVPWSDVGMTIGIVVFCLFIILVLYIMFRS